MREVDRIRSDIELTRAELAGTVDALQARLDVRAIARSRAAAAGERTALAYAHAKGAAPEPVRHALARAEHAAAPALAAAASDKKRTALIACAVVVALLVARRARRS